MSSNSILFVHCEPRDDKVKESEQSRSAAMAHAARISVPRREPTRSPFHGNSPPGLRPQTVPSGSPSRPRYRRILRKGSREGRKGDHDGPRSRHDYAGLNNYHELTLTWYKGNSDPFSSTSVEVSPLDISLVKEINVQSVRIIWANESAVRGNYSVLLQTYNSTFSGLLGHPAELHAKISQACMVRSQADQPNDNYSSQMRRLGEKHKLQAINATKDLVKTYEATRTEAFLRKIYFVALLLAPLEAGYGNKGAAQTHLAGAREAMKVLGGWTSARTMSTENDVFGIVWSGWFERTRPLFQPELWDPGEKVAAFFSPLLRSGGISEFCRTVHRSGQLQQIFDQTRVLLSVEKFKATLPNPQDGAVTPLFQWSTLRKLAVRARNLIYWCDLRDGEIDDSDPEFSMLMSLTIRCFEETIFEAIHYPNVITARQNQALFAELGAHPLLTLAEQPDRHRRQQIDLLWVYSVGAFIAAHTAGLSFLQGYRASVLFDFSTAFGDLAMELGFIAFDDLTAFLRREYLYYPRAQDEFLNPIFQAALERHTPNLLKAFNQNKESVT
jgi:hypothetical protein